MCHASRANMIRQVFDPLNPPDADFSAETLRLPQRQSGSFGCKAHRLVQASPSESSHAFAGAGPACQVSWAGNARVATCPCLVYWLLLWSCAWASRTWPWLRKNQEDREVSFALHLEGRPSPSAETVGPCPGAQVFGHLSLHKPSQERGQPWSHGDDQENANIVMGPLRLLRA